MGAIMGSGNRKLSKRLLGSFVGCALLLTSGAAGAACGKNNLVGTWKFYKHFYLAGSTFTGWSVCNLLLRNANGVIKVRSASNCEDDAGTTESAQGGRFKINVGGTNCKVTGNIKLPSETLRVVDAQMEKANKTTFSGVGTDTLGGRFNFTAVKQ